MSTPNAASQRARYALPAAFFLLMSLLGAWLMWPSASSRDPSSRRAASDARDPSSPPAVEIVAQGEETFERATTASADPSALERATPAEGFQLSAPPGAIPPSTRPFESPQAASAFVEERVLDLFAAVSPEIDPKTIHKSCEPDGRICTFDGPWPGDDFLREWLRAISEGRTGLAAMEGVRFSEFRPVEIDGERRFVVKAHAP